MTLPHLFIDADGVIQARQLGWADARTVAVHVRRPGLDATMPIVLSNELSRRVERLAADVHLLTYWCEHSAYDDVVMQADGPRFPNRTVAPFPEWEICGYQSEKGGAFADAAHAAGRVSGAAPPVACATTTNGCGLPHPPQPRDIRTAHRYVSNPHWKPQYIVETLRRDPRPFVWLDDEEVPVYGELIRAEFSDLPHLIMAPSTAHGLTSDELKSVEKFLAENN